MPDNYLVVYASSLSSADVAPNPAVLPGIDAVEEVPLTELEDLRDEFGEYTRNFNIAQYPTRATRRDAALVDMQQAVAAKPAFDGWVLTYHDSRPVGEIWRTSNEEYVLVTYVKSGQTTLPYSVDNGTSPPTYAQPEVFVKYVEH